MSDGLPRRECDPVPMPLPQMQPLLSVVLDDSRRVFHPGEGLGAEVQVDAVAANEITAVEISVLWYTEGKGDEDFAVHWFERRTPADAEEGDLRRLHKISTVLPQSPLSYTGVIVKIRWCVRMRVFMKRGREFVREQPFELLARHESLRVAASLR